MDKNQQFVVDGMLYTMQSTYHQEENVWTADIEPYEWNTESQMRKDMLIHFLSEESPSLANWYQHFDCRDEDEVIDVYEKYHQWLSKDDYEYNPDNNL